MKKIIQRLIHRLPKYKRNIWYNYSAHTTRDNVFPKVFNAKGKYIPCNVGLQCVMCTTKDGRAIYYEVCSTKLKYASDWLYPSDSIECDMKFSHIGRRLKGSGGE